GDGQSAEPDDVVGYAAQRQNRITGVAVGGILLANSDLFNKATVCPTNSDKMSATLLKDIYQGKEIVVKLFNK
ncbi:hypothetical protein NGB58_24905, partial [Escherichia coli]|nr:hypothetical protein [Escherichia coli]